MDTTPPASHSRRFIERQDVNDAISTIKESAATLHFTLCDTSPDYDSSVIFSYIEGQPVATPITTLEAPNAQWYRHCYRRENIEDSFVVISGTALGKAVRNNAFNEFASSEINQEMPQVVHSERLIHDDTLAGVMQRSFTPSDHDGAIKYLPDHETIDTIDASHRSDLARAAAHLAFLNDISRRDGSLGLLLEHKQALAPDVYWIRIDVINSTHYATGIQQPAYDAYQNQCQILYDTLLREYEQRYLVDQYGIKTGYSDEGDGASIRIPLPEAYNPYDERTLQHYHRYSIEPFLDRLQAELDAIALQYKKDLYPIPRVTINGSFGNASVNGRGRHVSPILTKLAQIGKHKSP